MRAIVFSAVAVALAGFSGFLASMALSGAQQEPTRTVTINVATGPTGPAGPKGDQGEPGPQGPPGPSGATTCPTGYSFGVLKINAPGGQVTLFTCLLD